LSRKTPKAGRILIGTSGWSYPHWVGPFYPKTLPTTEHLAYYIRQFCTVEINNTFYHLPSRQTLEAWREETPKGFLFSCKASRFITHMKKLKDPEQSTQKFFEAIQVLGPMLGPILFQLPPRWKMNVERLDHFLQVLPQSYRFVFEFRDDTWFPPETYDRLRAYGAGLCLYHLAGRMAPIKVTADFVYIRLHGPGSSYQGLYGVKGLRSWADRCVKWAQSGKDVYCYFDNDEAGYAVKDALNLQNLVDRQWKHS